MKPNGLAFDLGGGTLRARVTSASRAEDKIWEAVEEAISEGMTPRQFRIEAACAWDHELRQRAKDAHDDLTKD